jgi:hypothetical protein
MSTRIYRAANRTLLATPLLTASFLAIAPGAAAAQSVAPWDKRAAVYDAAAACSTDRYRFCGGVAAGGGRIARCLAANEDRLSGDCRAALRYAWHTLASDGPYADSRYGDAPDRPFK